MERYRGWRSTDSRRLLRDLISTSPSDVKLPDVWHDLLRQQSFLRDIVVVRARRWNHRRSGSDETGAVDYLVKRLTLPNCPWCSIGLSARQSARLDEHRRQCLLNRTSSSPALAPLEAQLQKILRRIDGCRPLLRFSFKARPVRQDKIARWSSARPARKPVAVEVNCSACRKLAESELFVTNAGLYDARNARMVFSRLRRCTLFWMTASSRRPCRQSADAIEDVNRPWEVKGNLGGCAYHGWQPILTEGPGSAVFP